MFKKTTLASTICMALFGQCVYAADEAAEQTQNAQANDNNDSLEIIEVVGIRSSLNKAVNIKRQSIQVVDAIVAEDIGKFPDNNLVEALQRVTGVQVTDRASGEVNTVTIRGLTDVTTTINGREMFTAAGRQLAVADIPAALLESVEVYKTRNASQLASGIAGQLNVRTQRPFNFEGSKVVVNARGVYQDQSEETDPIVSVLASNRWESSVGDVGALINLSFASTSYRDENSAPGGFVPFRADNLNRIYPWPTGLEHGMDRTPGATMYDPATDSEVEYYLSRDALNQSDLTGKRERPAVNLSFQWAPNDTSEYIFEAFYNGYRNESNNHLLFSYADSSRVETVTQPVLFEGTNVIKSRAWGDSGAFTSGDFSKSQTDSYMFALGGKWALSEDATLKSELVYQTSKYEREFVAMQANTRFPFVMADFNHEDGIMAWTVYDEEFGTPLDLTDPSLWTTSTMFDNGGEDNGDGLTFTLDLDFYVDWGIFTKAKAGVRYDKRTADSRSRDSNRFNPIPLASLGSEAHYVNSDFFDGKSDLPRSWVAFNAKNLWQNRAEYRDTFNFYDSADGERRMTLQKNFDIDQTSWAAYVQSQFETQLFGNRLDGDIGLRYTYAGADMDFYHWDGEVGGIVQSTGRNSSAKFLPNLTLRYHLSDDLITRFAYTQTLRRPEFGQLNSFINLRPDTTNVGYGNASGGNQSLRPVESTNYDFSLEYYFNEGSSAYATYFYRDIEGFVFDSLRQAQFPNPETGEMEDYILSQPGNTSNGVLKGVEVGLVYFPESVPQWLDGIGLQASGTFLDSDQDIPIFSNEGELTGYTNRSVFGVSDTSYSGVLIYERENFSTRLSYVWRDSFLNRYGSGRFAHPRGVYRRPEQSLDFQVSYDVTEDLVVTFDATNLTDEVYRQYYELPTVLNDSASIYSRTFGLGFRYSF
ncbi:TonB-dependent receptor [Pseudoalteromonas shioyasakiensis]|uniref:TonB-dependent receptor n=1 Tax=Pseudoalteromonas shioyasakiensis TaxID=1190813 RepID=UPI002551DE19|nr:TonB-dependent receptor [Pseudoalteromonas shioyasakiensis]MDK9682763.1 TonB-dependent receptor [Pseudoalteromonas shioyasakiensis]